ncbi:MAG: thiamine-phosphate kinase [Deltaproteobacteria bacterium]|nr:thiamine-phosphate kinase [Deltaproteobacteria bacterium]
MFVIGEFGLIKRIAGKAERKDKSVLVGIGDDAAVITRSIPPLISGRKGGVSPLLVTTDSLIEDVHFRRDFPPEAIGWKALAVNISDIAAMGGVPEHCLLSLGIPDGISIEYIDRFVRGMTEAAEEYGLSLIGGDTTSSPDRLYISVTVLGKGSDNVLLRKGARAGDVIFVTGTLGDSALGLKIVEESGVGSREFGAKFRNPQSAIRNQLIERHLRPTPRVREGIQLANIGMVTSMIDISDGLLCDLGHICEESRVGARIRIDELPLSQGFNALSAKYGGIELALSGGEDYELLFTVRSKDVKNFMSMTEGTKYTPIGEVSKDRVVEVIEADGNRYLPKSSGYEHFRR